MAKLASCRECGGAFQAKRATQEFCCAACRRVFNNRKMVRGAALYDLVMVMRHNRAAAKDLGAWTLLCRMAAAFKAVDDRDRNGRRSWDDVGKVKSRNPYLSATIVGVNVDGVKRA
jgi:hypothetical protein